MISIHALLAESDQIENTLSKVVNHFYPRSPCGERRCPARGQLLYLGISIHALLAESDILGNVVAGLRMLFLSTLSLRRATINPTSQTNLPGNFYPRSPCGERRDTVSTRDRPKEFLSTLSLRRATDVIAVMTDAQSISIHALLAESDSSTQWRL